MFTRHEREHRIQNYCIVVASGKRGKEGEDRASGRTSRETYRTCVRVSERQSVTIDTHTHKLQCTRASFNAQEIYVDNDHFLLNPEAIFIHCFVRTATNLHTHSHNAQPNRTVSSIRTTDHVPWESLGNYARFTFKMCMNLLKVQQS